MNDTTKTKKIKKPKNNADLWKKFDDEINLHYFLAFLFF